MCKHLTIDVCGFGRFIIIYGVLSVDGRKERENLIRDFFLLRPE